MNQLERYHGETENNIIIEAETDAAQPTTSSQRALIGLLGRWRIIFFTLVVFCLLSIPPIWLFVRPKYQAEAAIHVAPVVYSLVFTDQQSDQVLPMYENFKNTQAQLIFSPTVLQRVADELYDKDISLFQKQEKDFPAAAKQAWTKKDLKILFQENVSPVDALREAMAKGALTVTPDRRSELIKIAMISPSPQEAEMIVNAFVNAYRAVILFKYEQGGDEKLSLLEVECDRLAKEVEQQQKGIQLMAEEYGSADLEKRHEMMLANVAELQTQLTRIQVNRAELEAHVKLREETKGQEVSPDKRSEVKLLKERNEYINADEKIRKLTDSIIQAEQTLIYAEQTMAADNPDLKLKADFIKALEERMKQRRAEVEKEFDTLLERNQKDELGAARLALENTKKYEAMFQQRADKANQDAIELGKKHLLIGKKKDQLTLTKNLYDTIRKSIEEHRMEQKRPARISVAYNASSTQLADKRVKLTVAVIFAALLVGVFLAFLREKSDQRLQTPDDIYRTINIPIIGTTISPERINRKMLSEHLIHDYQTIRANIKLLNDGVMPRKLIVTSPQPREGKTTFSINLATSLAKSGCKVLLIDGDLRKPDIGRLLNLPHKPAGLHDLVMGSATLNEVVSIISLTGLHVLAFDGKLISDPLEFLSQSETAQCIEHLAGQYDHIIIDTPPVLVVPDCLIWAKMADAAVLSSLSGATIGPALKEAVDKLTQIKVKILGNVMSNVRPHVRYGKYGYGYGYGAKGSAAKSQRHNTSLLLPTAEADANEDNS